jgi:dCMP deaminase
MMKRKNYISWDDYFMGIVQLSAMRSKDPSTQVGACIVNNEKKIIGIGYNGFPIGCSDDILPWGKGDDNELVTKYPYVCHAEMNAIMNKNNQSLKDCIIYVSLFPCNECAKLIIQSGIKKIIYLSDKQKNTNHNVASKKLLDMVNIIYEKYIPTNNILINFNQI